MKKKICLGMIVTLSLLVGMYTICMGEDTESLKAPKVSIEEPSFTFSPVIEGNEASHDFIIRNKGTAPLEILKVKSG